MGKIRNEPANAVGRNNFPTQRVGNAYRTWRNRRHRNAMIEVTNGTGRLGVERFMLMNDAADDRCSEEGRRHQKSNRRYERVPSCSRQRHHLPAAIIYTIWGAFGERYCAEDATNPSARELPRLVRRPRRCIAIARAFRTAALGGLPGMC